MDTHELANKKKKAKETIEENNKWQSKKKNTKFKK